MSATVSAVAAGAAGAQPASADRMERLRQATRDMEGVFVQQLFKAMRDTVPRDGLVEGGSGEEMFTSMLDQQLAGAVPSTWQRGLSDAILRQLHGRAGLGAESAAAGMPDTGHAASSPAGSTPILPLTVPPDASIPEQP